MKIKKFLLSTSIALFGISAPITAVTTTQVSAATKKVKLTKEQKAVEKEVKKIKSSAKSGKVPDLSSGIGKTYTSFVKANKKKTITLEGWTHTTSVYGISSKLVYVNAPHHENGKIIHLVNTKYKNNITVKELKRVLGQPTATRNYLSYYSNEKLSTVYDYRFGKYKVEFQFPNNATDSSTLIAHTVIKADSNF